MKSKSQTFLEFFNQLGPSSIKEDKDSDTEAEQETDPELDASPEPDSEEKIDDPSKMGVIRVVKNAHLVYKRKNTDGQYDELWIYGLDKGMKDELNIRRNILAATDIPTDQTESEDGSQKYELWTVGNAQLMQISNLPS